MLRNLGYVLLIGIALLSACTLGATEQPSRGLYTDQEVETFIEKFPGLANALNGDPVPRNVLERLAIDIAALQIIDITIGGCITLTEYELSSSYDLLVDDNACSGYQVLIKER